MNTRKTLSLALLLPTLAFAEASPVEAVAAAADTTPAAPPAAAPAVPAVPSIMFTLPWRGELAVLLNMGAISIGTSGAVRQTRELLQTLPKQSLPLAVSCADTQTRMAVHKALKSIDDNALDGSVLLLMDGERCKPGLQAQAERAGMKVAFSDMPHLYQLLRRGGIRLMQK